MSAEPNPLGSQPLQASPYHLFSSPNDLADARSKAGSIEHEGVWHLCCFNEQQPDTDLGQIVDDARKRGVLIDGDQTALVDISPGSLPAIIHLQAHFQCAQTEVWGTQLNEVAQEKLKLLASPQMGRLLSSQKLDRPSNLITGGDMRLNRVGKC